MAMTLVEASKYSQSELDREVIYRLAKDSVILERLPFEDVVGNALVYDTITTDSGADFYNVNEEWVQSEPTVTQATATIKILGGDADTDNFIKATRSNIIDVQQEVLENKIKAVRDKFSTTFIYGDDSSDTKSFDGLHVLLSDTTYNTVHAGATTGTALSMAKLYEACDLVRGGGQAILMSKKMRRLIQIYLDSIGEKMPQDRDDYGKLVSWFQNMPIYADDFILNTETASSGAYAGATGGNCSSIFIVNFGGNGVKGLQNGAPQTVVFPDLESKDGSRVRIKWYCGLMLKDLRLSAKVDGILTTAAVTA